MTSNADLHFEGRNIKPYAQPVSASELEECEVYYSVTFVDEEMHIPSIETIVFVGRDFDGSDQGKLYFQDIDSYRNGIRYESATPDDYAEFFCCSEDGLNNIFEYERALEELMHCSLRRSNNA